MPQINVVKQLLGRFEQPLPSSAVRRIVIWHDPAGELAGVFAELAANGFDGGSEEAVPAKEDEGAAFSAGCAGAAAGGDGSSDDASTTGASETSASEPGGWLNAVHAAEGLARPVRFVEAADGCLFNTKRLLYREDTQNDILLYRRRARGELEGDWLADVELYAEHFQADYVSLLIDELGVSDTDEVREALRMCKTFFNAAPRRRKFAALAAGAATRDAVEAGILAVLAGVERPTVEDVTRGLAMALADDEPGTLARLRKMGAQDAFARFLQMRIGFDVGTAVEGDAAGDNGAASFANGAADGSQLADDIVAHLLASAASCTLPPEAFAGLDRFLSPEHARFCLTIVHSWMAAGDAARAGLLEMAQQVEERCDMASRLEGVSREALLRTDVLPCVDEVLLSNLMGQLTQGLDCCDEASRVIAQRRSTVFGERLTPYYDALSAAVEAQRFHRAHAGEYHLASAVDVWKAYTSEWYVMDTHYRRFCCAFEECLVDANPALEDATKGLADYVDGIYADFLTRSNECWANAAEAAWAQTGWVEGIARQRRFYDDVVLSELAGSAKRVVVAVSDALRYEVAAELRDRLERETKGNAELGAMQGMFPSTTPFGMAALLSHARMQLNEADLAVLVDGMPTATAAEREAVLRQRNPKSRAIKYVDLQRMKRAERKALSEDAQVIYVYHNAVDAAGEGAHGEREVFDACEDALQELVALAKIAVNDLGASRMVVTSDHGFLCTRKPLREADHVSAADMEGTAALLGRRYAVLAGEASSDLLIRMNMDDVGGGSYTGLSPRSCLRIKRPGPGENYVHGGVSLQELAVPVVRFRNAKAGSKGYAEAKKAQLALLGTNRRITSNLFSLDLYQTEAVAGKVAPETYELALVDEAGNEVSDVQTVVADWAAPHAEDRRIRVNFALRAGVAFSERATYYLVARVKSSRRIAWREEFRVMVAFNMMDDFGF